MRVLSRAQDSSPTSRFEVTRPDHPRRLDVRGGRPVTRTLLVTNDYPPKVGGIQTYLGELWRRLDPVDDLGPDRESPHPDAAALRRRARAQTGLRVRRVAALDALPADAVGRSRAVWRAPWRPSACGRTSVLLDPYVPLGMLGRRLGVPLRRRTPRRRGVAIPARACPSLRRVARSGSLRGATVVVSAGTYPRGRGAVASRARRAPMPPRHPGAASAVDTARGSRRRCSARAAASPRCVHASGCDTDGPPRRLRRPGSFRERGSTCSSRPWRAARRMRRASCSPSRAAVVTRRRLRRLADRTLGRRRRASSAG